MIKTLIKNFLIDDSRVPFEISEFQTLSNWFQNLKYLQEDFDMNRFYSFYKE